MGDSATGKVRDLQAGAGYGHSQTYSSYASQCEADLVGAGPCLSIVNDGPLGYHNVTALPCWMNPPTLAKPAHTSIHNRLP